MQFLQTFLLLPYKNGYKRTIFRGVKFRQSFQKYKIETKYCYLQIGKICEGRLYQLFHRQIDCLLLPSRRSERQANHRFG